MNTVYEDILKMVNGIDTECSGVDDNGVIWIYIGAECFYFELNEDGNVDVYDVHYSDMIARMDTIEVYPVSCTDDWLAFAIADWLNTHC